MNPHRFSDNIESYEKGDDENERTAVLWLGLSGGAHAEILRRLIETNLEQTAGYGLDTYSDAARAKIRRACRSPRAEIHFLSGGTQTNRIVISSLLHPYEGVIAADTGHITVHEAGAIECGGHKVLALPHADGSRLTEKSYTSAGIFSEGLASVMEDKKHVGFIDKTGAEVIAPQYASASIFSEGLAAVEVGGKWGFIDRTGTMVIAPQYREIPMGFSEGLAAVRGKKGLAYIDKTGTQVFAAPYDNALPFHDGLAEVRRKVKSTNFLGAVLTIAAGTAGQFIYDPLMLDDENVKRGYIDKTGTMIISIKNDYNSTFVDGTALVKVKSRWGCVDRTGAYLVPANYRMMRHFSEDLAAVQDTAELWGYAAKDGSVAIAPTYNAVQDFHEGLAAVVKGGKPFFIDKTGRVPFLTPSTVTELGSFAAGLAPAKVGDKWGYIDHSGSMVIAPQYEDASMFLVGQTKK